MRRPRADWPNLLAGFADFAEGESKSRIGAATRHIRDTGVSYCVYGRELELSWPLQLLPLIKGQRKWAEIVASADRSDSRVCLPTLGPFSETYFEQAHLTRDLGFLLVQGAGLVARDGKAYVRTTAGLKRADAILRRVDADYLDPIELNGASQLGTLGYWK